MTTIALHYYVYEETIMHVNADFTRPVTISADRYHWVASTQPGVERMMLDRIGGEKARATTVVRYAPQSSFPHHIHPGGEEILVLSGTFSDSTGDYSEGWYLRNPPSSTHTPFSTQGTTIFVKLWQMREEDTKTQRINTKDLKNWQCINGRAVCVLFHDRYETASLEKVPTYNQVCDLTVAATEILVVEGSVKRDGITYHQGSWLRLPQHSTPQVYAGEQGAIVYIKQGEFVNIESEA
ncbi:cupin domain-containing protein [Photobacterium lucens]|uniref:cupin domain-containing protein n=1 Tax=Photobacterium lucens TaxID=2562949 RepID=UPI001F447EBB|nr:cupin domain-containing protein [Photobacterium lucens]